MRGEKLEVYHKARLRVMELHSIVKFLIFVWTLEVNVGVWVVIARPAIFADIHGFSANAGLCAAAYIRAVHEAFSK